MDELTIFYRLLLAVILGGLVGFERERSHKFAGLRTHTLVALAAALVTMTALYGFDRPSSEASARIIANILVGIGFIGGGAILRQDTRVIGTTTAATLFIVAAIGIAVGVGFLYAAITTTIITYIILTIMWRLERKIEGSNHESETFHPHS